MPQRLNEAAQVARLGEVPKRLAFDGTAVPTDAKVPAHLGERCLPDLVRPSAMGFMAPPVVPWRPPSCERLPAAAAGRSPPPDRTPRARRPWRTRTCRIRIRFPLFKERADIRDIGHLAVVNGFLSRRISSRATPARSAVRAGRGHPDRRLSGRAGCTGAAGERAGAHGEARPRQGRATAVPVSLA